MCAFSSRSATSSILDSRDSMWACTWLRSVDGTSMSLIAISISARELWTGPRSTSVSGTRKLRTVSSMRARRVSIGFKSGERFSPILFDRSETFEWIASNSSLGDARRRSMRSRRSFSGLMSSWCSLMLERDFSMPVSFCCKGLRSTLVDSPYPSATSTYWRLIHQRMSRAPRIADKRRRRKILQRRKNIAILAYELELFGQAHDADFYPPVLCATLGGGV